MGDVFRFQAGKLVFLFKKDSLQLYSISFCLEAIFIHTIQEMPTLFMYFHVEQILGDLQSVFKDLNLNSLNSEIRNSRNISLFMSKLRSFLLKWFFVHLYLSVWFSCYYCLCVSTIKSLPLQPIHRSLNSNRVFHKYNLNAW